MLTLTSNEQAQSLIHNNILAIDDDIEIAFDGFEIDADIKCKNIYSKYYRRNINVWDIKTRDIKAGDIKAANINARDINAWDIKARYINVGDINAKNIDARNIDAWDINAMNINARNINAANIYVRDINYYVVCFAYCDIRCQSIKGRHLKAKHFCLDGKIIIKDQEMETK